MPGSSIPAASPFRRSLRVLALVAWAALIFAASDRPDLRVSDDDMLDLVLRKAAHLFVFGVLAILAARVLEDVRAARPWALPMAWLATVAYAASDEWHQTFVPGRAGQPRDVAIDAAGALVALLLLHAARIRARPPTTRSTA